jgi:hypothetical protein
VWALGVMIYEMIVGKRPFARPRPAEEAAAALLGSCPRLAAADRRAGDELAKLVARCFALDPAARPTAAELARAIDAMIDWTDAISDERAAAVADPASYQARIAAFRVGRVERIAREALDAGQPFEALTSCDRGLAYAPEHAGLLALVAAAEVATAHRAPAPIARTPVRRPISRRWLIGIGAVLGGLVIVGVLMRDTTSTPPTNPATSSDPWGDGAGPPSAAAPTGTVKLIPSESDRAMMKDFVSLFGRAMNSSDAHAASKSKAPTEEDKAMMRDMLSLFGRAMDHPDAKPAR